MLTRRNFLQISSSVALSASPLAAFAAPVAPIEGKQYTVVRPAVPVKGPKVEVVDFFAYTCPHCIKFAPVIEPWSRKLPSWIDYKQVPVAWDSKTEPFVRAYYAMQATGLLPKLHMKFFESVIYQTHKYEFATLVSDIRGFMTKNGVKASDWDAAYNSFGVANKTRAATQIWQSYGVDATPMVGIDGKYLTGPHMTPTREDCLSVIETLAQKARKSRA